jgi:hypothetical protein
MIAICGAISATGSHRARKTTRFSRIDLAQ